MPSPLRKAPLPAAEAHSLNPPWVDGTAPAPLLTAAPAWALPGAERKPMGIAHGGSLLPAWVQRLRLAAPSHRARSAVFAASNALQERWARLFDLRQDAAAPPYPLLLAQGVCNQLQARVLAELGVLQRNVRQVRQHTRLPQGAAAFAAARQQRLDCRLRRLVRLSPTEVLALLQTRISSEDQTLALVEDSFLLEGLSAAQVRCADEDDLLRRAYSRARRRQPEIDCHADGVHLRQLFLATDVDRRFGRLAAERPWLAWPRRGAAVVQNLYLRNLVSRELAEWGFDQDRLDMHFTAPAHVGQTLCLRVQGRQFELLNEAGQLVAFGESAR